MSGAAERDPVPPTPAWRGRFARDVAWLQGANVVRQGTQVATTVAIAVLLGAAGQGAYVSAIALQSLLFFLVNVGVHQGTTGQIAAAAARGNHAKVAGWVAFLVKLTLLVGLAAVALGFPLLPPLAEWLLGEREVGVWAAWLCLQPLVELPREVAAVTFQGTRRMAALARLETGHELARAFLVVAGALVTGSAAGAVLGHLAGGLVGTLLAAALWREARREAPLRDARREGAHTAGGAPLPTARETLGHVRDVDLWRGMRLGLRVAGLKNLHSLFQGVLPRLALGAVASVSWVGWFHVAQRIVTLPLLAMHPLSRTLLPVLGEHAGRRDLTRFRALFRRATWLGGGAVALATITAVLLVPPVVGALFPPDYAEPVFLLAAILAPGYIAQGFTVGIEAFFIVANRIRAWYAVTLAGAVVCVPPGVWLVLTYPETGTAWAVSLGLCWAVVPLAYALGWLRRADMAWRRSAPGS